MHKLEQLLVCIIGISVCFKHVWLSGSDLVLWNAYYSAKHRSQTSRKEVTLQLRQERD